MTETRARIPLDFYRTPEWLVEALVPHLPYDDTVLDPACGDGAILHVLSAHYDKTVGIDVDAERLERCACSEKHLGNALEMGSLPDVGLVVMNPPYQFAMDFVQHHVERYPFVAALLRLGFLAGQRRAPWLRKNPCDVLVTPRRPSFAFGATDASDYAWFLWGPSTNGKITILETETKGKA